MRSLLELWKSWATGLECPKPRQKGDSKRQRGQGQRRDHCLFAAKSGDPENSSTKPVPEPSRLTMSSEQMEKLRASNPSISHYAWLVQWSHLSRAV